MAKSNLVRLVEMFERSARKDVQLEIRASGGRTNIAVNKFTRNQGTRQVVPTHSGAPTRDIEALAFDVMEDLAEEAIKQGLVYKPPRGE